MLRYLLAVLACLLLWLPLRAQQLAPLPASAPDSLVQVRAAPGPPRLWQRPVVRQLLPPVLLLTAGALTTHKVALLETDEETREEIREHVGRPLTQLDNQMRYLPGAVALGLGLAGVRGRHRPVDQLLLAALAFTLNDAATSNLKKLTQVQRPDGSDYHSFPSQHTSLAFASATLLHKEYGGRSAWYSVGGYSVAAATAGIRMAKDVHWLSDVLAGAGVGILSTEAAYWLYPRVTKPLRKVLGNRALVLPSYQQGAFGAMAVVRL
ncbi:phosphatase PAP2 family protein [Hymenobacter sp. IS2118]|uniref:phosphatase PAP2 family protein n=1 Tax=Hymenobacter sp. IS2118 TaxID=1505605 RepID=UPI00068D25CC|nr:phosphatase PAP2 family protein [Hymenobacter sp. IS2118]